MSQHSKESRARTGSTQLPMADGDPSYISNAGHCKNTASACTYATGCPIELSAFCATASL
eukprot:1137259-Pelagomonas_calceolata.AAC.4